MDHTFREIVLKIDFIRLWYVFFYIWLHWTLPQQKANISILGSSTVLSHVPNAAGWRSSLWHKERIKEEEMLHKNITNISCLGPWSCSGTIHDLDLSWNLHLRNPVLYIVLLSNPNLLELYIREKSGEESDGQLLRKMRISLSKRGACPWRSVELKIIAGQVKARL